MVAENIAEISHLADMMASLVFAGVYSEGMAAFRVPRAMPALAGRFVTGGGRRYGASAREMLASMILMDSATKQPAKLKIARV